MESTQAIIENDELKRILHEVKDPEIPTISVVELGVLREARFDNDKLKVVITPTYSGCPAMDVMEHDILAKLKEYGYENIDVERRLSPAWTTDWMDETAKEKLLESKIAPPIGNAFEVNKQFKVFNFPTIPCPYCGSKETEMKSEFGTTACKSLYQCKSCGQPFDYFKVH